MTASPWGDADVVRTFEFAELHAPTEVVAGTHDVVVGNLLLNGLRDGLHLESLTLTGTGTASLGSVASSVKLYADLDGDPLGTFETLVGSGVVNGNKAVITLGQSLGDGIAMQMAIDTKAGAKDADVGLDLKSITVVDANGRNVPKSHVGSIDSNDSTVRVRQQRNVLTFDLTPPANGDVVKGERNVVLGTLLVNTTEGDAVINRLAIAVEARDSGYQLTANVGQELLGIELRNEMTGQTVQGTLKKQGTGYQVLTLSNFIVRDGDRWQIRADIGDNAFVQEGDRYRVHVNLMETGTTTFNGLLPKALGGVDVNAKDIDSNRAITQVGPGGTLSGGYVQVGQSRLTVAVQSIGTANTAVTNENHLLGLRFIAQAGEIEDVLLASVAVNAANGSIHNADRLSLWADADGDGVIDAKLDDGYLIPGSGIVMFDDLVGGGYVVPKGVQVMFEVRFDAASTLASDPTMQLVLNQLQAESARNGAPVETPVHFAESTLWSFVRQGNLFVTKSLIPIPSRQLLGGTLGESVIALTLRGDGEPIDVTKLAFGSIGSAASSVDRLELFLAGATSPFAIATRAGTGTDPVLPGTSVFTAHTQSRQLVVGEGEDLTIFVRPRIKSDVQGGVSGETVQFELLRAEARGSISSNNLLANNEDDARQGEVFIGTSVPGPNARIIGSQNVVVMSKVTAIANASPDADGTHVPTGIAAGGQFTLTTASNANAQNGLNRVVIDALLFTLRAQQLTVDASSFFLYNKADASQRVGAVLKDAAGNVLTGTVRLDGTYYVEAAGLKGSGVNTWFDSGSGGTLVVGQEVLDAPQGASLQYSLEAFSNALADMFGINGSHVKWFDADVSERIVYGFDLLMTAVRSTFYRNN